MGSWVELLDGGVQAKSMPASPFSAQLERAATGVAGRVVSGGAGSYAGSRHASSLRTTNQIGKALGGPSFLKHNDAVLIGVGSDGNRREFGACLVNGKQVTFDWWIPHLGIAIDCNEKLQEEIDAKLAWVRADDRRILYFPPTTPVELIEANAKTRRKAREDMTNG